MKGIRGFRNETQHKRSARTYKRNYKQENHITGRCCTRSKNCEIIVDKTNENMCFIHRRVSLVQQT